MSENEKEVLPGEKHENNDPGQASDMNTNVESVQITSNSTQEPLPQISNTVDIIPPEISQPEAPQISPPEDGGKTQESLPQIIKNVDIIPPEISQPEAPQISPPEDAPSVATHLKSETSFSIQSVEKNKEDPAPDAMQTVYKKTTPVAPVGRVARKPTFGGNVPKVTLLKTTKEIWDTVLPPNDNGPQSPRNARSSVSFAATAPAQPNKPNSKAVTVQVPNTISSTPTASAIKENNEGKAPRDPIPVRVSKTKREVWDIDPGALPSKPTLRKNENIPTESVSADLKKKPSIFNSFKGGDHSPKQHKMNKRRSVQVSLPLNGNGEIWESVLPKEKEKDADKAEKLNDDDEEYEDGEDDGQYDKEVFAKPKTSYNPRSSYNFLQQWFFSYMTSFVRDCARNDLTLSQYPPIEKEDNSKTLGYEFLAKFNEREGLRSGEKPSVYSAISKTYGYRFMLYGIPYLLESFIRIGQAFALGLLLEALRNDEAFSSTTSTKDGFLSSNAAYVRQASQWAAVLCGLVIAQFTISQAKMFYTIRAGMQLRVAITTAIFEKSLRLPSSAFSHGQLTSLITGDLQKFEDVAQHLHYLWVAPVEVGIVTILLYLRIQLAGVIAIGSLLFLYLIQTLLAGSLIQTRQDINRYRDERIEKLSSMVPSIALVKLFAWEDAFIKMIGDVRVPELGSLQKFSFRRALSESVFFSTSVAISMIAFGYFKLTGGTFTPAIVFTTCMYIALLRQTLSNNLFRALQFNFEFMAVLNRIQVFFEIPELQLKNDQTLEDFQDLEVIFAMKDASYSWGTRKSLDGSTVEQMCLQNLTLKLRKGELTGVCGPLGSGKTSLIHAIVGEAGCIAGSMGCTAESVAIVTQTPWIVAGTYRDNILFGKPYRKQWFDEVVKSCALDVDFAILPSKENCQIDERGQNLSGGVKARLSLARAVYSNADLYLLDDPLSTLDAKVARHVFQNCIKTVLKKKAVLLVSHTVSFIQECNQIIILENGKISAAGDFQSLKSTLDSPFATALQRLPLSPTTSPATNGNGNDNNVERQLQRLSLAKRRSIRSSKVDDDLADGDKNLTGTVPSIGISFFEYLRVGSSNLALFVLIASFLISQAFAITSDYWLAMWTDDVSLSTASRGDTFCLYIYIIFGGIAFVFAIARSILFYSSVLATSEIIFQRMLYSVFHAHSYFIQKTPLGRIINRFSKDLMDTDESLSQISFDFLQRALMVIGTLVIIAVAVPWTLLIYPFVLFIFFLNQRTYFNAGKKMKRLEVVTRSPIYTSIIVALEGKAVIRAFKAEERIHDKFCLIQNKNTRVRFASMSSARWLGIKTDGIACIFLVILVYFGVLFQNALSLPASYLGLMIYYSLQLLDMLQITVKQFAEVENLMSAATRTVEFAVNLPQESSDGEFPPDSWPEQGKIVLSNLSLRYPDSDVDTLSGVTATIPAGKKTCIIGRTGAGKTSLIQSIFRMYEPAPESIIIDDICVTELNLYCLRSRIAMIPQDPICFQGTIRVNLDPYSDYTDERIWAALESVRLKSKISASKEGLEYMLHQNGDNLSIGEKQLISLARALLREAKIIIMDEATSSIDIETEKIFKDVLYSLPNVTILCVAHHLSSIIEYDQVLVLNRGVLVEDGSPVELMKKDPADAASWFVRMVNTLPAEELAVLKSKLGIQ